MQLKCFYRTDEEVAVAELPQGTAYLVARHATGRISRARCGDHAPLGPLTPGTYVVEALSEDGRVLAGELTTVADHPGQRPVHGFATSFRPEKVGEVLAWLDRLRCTVVQIYDWMHRYSQPVGPGDQWTDFSGRQISLRALQALAAGTRSAGAVAHAYAPIYAADPAYSSARPDLLMYRGDGRPEHLFDGLQMVDPSNVDWQEHFVDVYGGAAEAIGFGGFHVDSYGFPRAARDASGTALDMRYAYASFLAFLRARRPADLISFNQVNGVPSAFSLPKGPGFRYCEIWAPNTLWRHFEGLLDRSAGTAGLHRERCGGGSPMRGTIACYPPVWRGHSDGPGRADALRTVVLTEAIATCLGAAALMYGDRTGVLCDAYYPRHERLSPDEATTALDWHRFALRVRDLFLDGEDTSWYDIADENGAVSVSWEGTCGPEPVGGTVFARVVRSEHCVAISVLDLTGSANGSWSEPAQAGRCRGVRVRALLDDPAQWAAAVMVLGGGGDDFRAVPMQVADHREGLAGEVAVPMVAGWSVLRLTRSGGRV